MIPNPKMFRISSMKSAALATSLVVGTLLCSCSSSDPKVTKKRSGSEMYRRIMSQEKGPSMFDPERSEKVVGKSFHTKSVSGKSYRSKSYVGTKAARTKSYIGSDKSSSWATRAARANQQAVSSDLDGAYKTSQSRDASKSARGTSGNYQTGTYRTNSDIEGTRGIENSQEPKIIGRRDLPGLSESQIRSMLGKQ